VSTLIDGNYILLNERADIVETKRHKDFRMFLCMNPPYTSAGKKALPWQLRSKLTEIYAPELDNQTDIWMIIDRYAGSIINEPQKRKILDFYIRARAEILRATKRGNIGLRNLSRAIHMMKEGIKLQYPAIKAIYDSLFICFASHLD
jgi:midasin